jgi:guanylate kinase
MTTGKIIILSAPSGTGKTTLLKRVMADIKRLVFSVSHTTRKPRPGEKNGIDYHFVDEAEFLQMRSDNQFLESAEVHGNYYGTSKAAVLEQLNAGYDVILDIDVQGASIIREKGKITATYIFLAPPSLEVLEKRLRGRAQDDEATIFRRLKNSRIEMQAAGDYEYLIINDQLEEAITMLSSVILAERAKAHRLASGRPANIGIEK